MGKGRKCADKAPPRGGADSPARPTARRVPPPGAARGAARSARGRIFARRARGAELAPRAPAAASRPHTSGFGRIVEDPRRVSFPPRRPTQRAAYLSPPSPRAPPSDFLGARAWVSLRLRPCRPRKTATRRLSLRRKRRPSLPALFRSSRCRCASGAGLRGGGAGRSSGRGRRGGGRTSGASAPRGGCFAWRGSGRRVGGPRIVPIGSRGAHRVEPR